MNSKVSSANESKAKPKSASKSPGRKTMNQPKSPTVAEGVYSNGRLMHTMTSLVGNIAQIVLKDGSVYEGALKTFSPKLDVVLESVIEVDKKSASDRGCTITSLIDSLNAKKTMSETMIFGIDSIVSVDLLDVDLDYAFKDGFKTDAEISGLKNAKAEKQLVEWVDDAPMPKRGTRDVSLEPSNGQTGWSAQDMFKYNEEVNGVVVGYKGLDNVYTTAINRDDPGYLEKERKAELLARQIIDGGRPCPEDEDECRDGRDEEQRWSEVYRKDVSYRSKEPSTRTTVPHPSKKPSDGNWRDTNPRVGSGEKSKQNLGKPQQDSPRQQFSVKNQNQHSPKPMADTHNYHTELSKKSPVLRTSSKEHVESGRPISFAAAVGLSEVKPGMPTLTQVRSHAVEAQKPEPVDVPEQNIIHDQEKSGLIDSPKVDQGVQKKSDVTSSEVEAVAKTSKLNPNAKEFTLNPTAKPFTPKNHFSPPPQPLIAHHPSVSQPNMGPASYQHNAQQQQQLQPHQQPKHHQQASQYLVMNTPGSNLVMPHQQVIGPNGQPFQLLNPVVVNQLPGNHNSNQYNPGYNQGNSQPSRKSHHGSREPRQGPGHSRHDNNSYNPHNVAAATGHPVLAGAPLTASGPLQFNHHHHQGGPPGPGQQTGPGGQPMFSPMFVQGYPRMFQPQMIGPYDHQYFMSLPMAVQPQQQQQQQPNNGAHSTPSTPQSQTPSTPGLHGPSTPGPGGHAVIPQTPSPQQSGVMYTGQAMHGPPGSAFNPAMVMMQAPHLGQNPHLSSGQVMITSSASGAPMQPHFNHNQPPPQRPV